MDGMLLGMVTGLMVVGVFPLGLIAVASEETFSKLRHEMMNG